MPLHIAILVHRHDAFEHTRYFAWAFAERWRDQGIKVSILREPTVIVHADIALLHADLTVVPTDYLDWAASFPRMINGGVADISKRRISRQLVDRGDDFRGRVFVKTDLNCGGKPEERQRRKASDDAMPRRWFGLVSRRAMRAAEPPAFDYLVYESLAHVPESVWNDPRLVVEQFLPEMHGDLFGLRMWVFMGDRETHMRSYSTTPVAKAATIVRQEPLGEVPIEIQQRRREMGFDFGKFDYVVIDGRPVLLDANRTPTVGRFPPNEFVPRIDHLADGLASLATR